MSPETKKQLTHINDNADNNDNAKTAGEKPVKTLCEAENSIRH